MKTYDETIKSVLKRRDEELTRRAKRKSTAMKIAAVPAAAAVAAGVFGAAKLISSQSGVVLDITAQSSQTPSDSQGSIYYRRMNYRAYPEQGNIELEMSKRISDALNAREETVVHYKPFYREFKGYDGTAWALEHRTENNPAVKFNSESKEYTLSYHALCVGEAFMRDVDGDKTDELVFDVITISGKNEVYVFDERDEKLYKFTPQNGEYAALIDGLLTAYEYNVSDEGDFAYIYCKGAQTINSQNLVLKKDFTASENFIGENEVLTIPNTGISVYCREKENPDTVLIMASLGDRNITLRRLTKQQTDELYEIRFTEYDENSVTIVFKSSPDDAGYRYTYDLDFKSDKRFYETGCFDVLPENIAKPEDLDFTGGYLKLAELPEKDTALYIRNEESRKTVLLRRGNYIQEINSEYVANGIWCDNIWSDTSLLPEMTEEDGIIRVAYSIHNGVITDLNTGETEPAVETVYVFYTFDEATKMWSAGYGHSSAFEEICI